MTPSRNLRRGIMWARRAVLGGMGEELCSKGEGHYVPQKIIFQWGGECNHVRTLLEEDKTGTIHCEARKDITLNCIMLNQFMLQSHQSVRKSSTM